MTRNIERPEGTLFIKKPSAQVTAPDPTPKTGAFEEPGPMTPVAPMTPMMAQYMEIKIANPDCLLFYRMGDFYELFFEDAEIASKALGIQLTKRGKHLGKDIQMCGVPHHAADNYMQKLIHAGHRVAVCEQTENPAEAKKRGAKSVVRRGVARLVTSGTLTEENLLNPGQNNFLTSLFECPKQSEDHTQNYALASVDISTGEFFVSEVSVAALPSELARLNPSEVLLSDSLISNALICAHIKEIDAALTAVPETSFDSLSAEHILKDHLNVATIEGFGDFSKGELAAMVAVLKYVKITQIDKTPALTPPKKGGAQTILMIDAATRSNLEMVRSTQGETKTSLLATIDFTVSAAGARTLRARLSSPLVETLEINLRLDAVGHFLDHRELREQLRTGLQKTPDLARSLSRISLLRAGPRDLGAVRDALISSKNLLKYLNSVSGLSPFPDEIKSIIEGLGKVTEGLKEALSKALEEHLPILTREGGFVRTAYRPDLDENRKLRDEGRSVIANLQNKYAGLTAVKSLKIRHNNVLGFFVEVTTLNAERLTSPEHKEIFIHRQTLASVMRFTTVELGEWEAKITLAGERAQAIEEDVFRDLSQQILTEEKGLFEVASALARVDLYAALAELAERQTYVRPKVDNSLAFEIKGGRHAVVERALEKAHAGAFIENDCTLGTLEARSPAEERPPGGERMWIVTGPNMAGKSTFLRQNALIVILAQMGSYVPARSAHIGVVDKLFSRVGASDDLARGRSTFMVEMVETASILNQASKHSLVILDEIGRGTATYDGLSIAWASVEYLHEKNRCRALFATHYHELTQLAQKLDHASNASVEVKEWQDEIIFLHKVIQGSADRSYGIQVAKLAGLPSAVITRAQEILHLLEKTKAETTAENFLDDLPLFNKRIEPEESPTSKINSAIKEAIETLNPDRLTPREALDALYKLKELTQEK